MKKNIEKNITRDALEIPLDELLSNVSTMSPADYQYYKGLKNRRIIINEEIGEDLLELAVIPFIDFDNDGTNEPIEIVISSYGGSIYEGFALVDAIENSKSPVTIRCMGVVASMGGLIAMAGYGKKNVKKVCSPFSVGLIHSGSTYLSGTSSSVRDTFKFSERYENRIKNYILTHTKIDEEMYEKIERQEFWMDSDELLEYGIVQEIIGK